MPGPMDEIEPPPFVLTQENDRLQQVEFAYYRAADRPGEVYFAMRRVWMSDTAEQFVQWLTRPGAVAREFATVDALAQFLEREAPGQEPQPSVETLRVRSFFTDADRVDMINKLVGATPTQIKNYVTTNVTDLASARILLMKILLLLATAIKQ